MQNRYRWIKILAICILTVALATAALAALLRARPGLALLLRSGFKSRSPFCSVWRAIPDVEIQIRQEETMDRIRQENRMLRRDGNVTLWQTTSGQYWVPSTDDVILPILLAQSARGIYGTGDRDVKPGDVVLDVGAYVGTFTRHALERGAKLVVAIEPSPTSVECLRRNLAPEIAAGKAIVYPKGIWDSEDLLTLFVNPNNTSGNSFLPFGEKSAGIRVTTISKVVSELNLPRIDFIKTDVKGATERLLRGGSDIIARDRPRMALSTEEVNDDPGAIAILARKIQPEYEMTPGPCLVNNSSIYTDVLFFR